MKYLLLAILAMLPCGVFAQGVIPGGGGGGGNPLGPQPNNTILGNTSGSNAPPIAINLGNVIGDVLGPIVSKGGHPGLPIDSGLWLYRTSPTGTDYGDVVVDRTTTFSGGSPNINSEIRALGTFGANDTSPEYGVLSKVTTNGKSGGLTVAQEGDAIRASGATDFIWAQILQAQDFNETGTSTTHGNLVALEVDARMMGDDGCANGASYWGTGCRFPMHLNQSRSDGATNTVSEISHFVLFDQTGSDDLYDNYTYNDSTISVAPNYQSRNFIDCRGLIAPQNGVTTNLPSCMSLQSGQVVDFNAPTTVGGAPGATLSYNSRNSAVASSGALEIDGATGTQRSLYFTTGGTLRWLFGPNSTAESGGNAGSDLVIKPYSDAGGLLTSYFTILRSTGTVLVPNSFKAGSGSANYLLLAGNSTGNSPRLTASGTDSNIDLTLAPTGTGLVRTTASPPAGDSGTAVPSTAWVLANAVPYGGTSAGKPAADATVGTITVDTKGQRICATIVASTTEICQSGLIYQSGAAITSTATASEQNLVSIAIPGNIIGANGSLRITPLFGYPNNGNTKSLQIRFGGVSGVSGSYYYNTSATTTVVNQNPTIIRNTNSTGSQIGFPSGPASQYGTSGSAVVTTAVDTTGITYVNIDCTTNGTDVVTLYGYIVEVLQGS